MEQADFENPPDAKKLKLESSETKSSTAADISCENRENELEPQVEDHKKDSKESTNCPSTDIQAVLMEKDVGISEYISKFEGFHGVIKQRYSDFLVNEISSSGQVVELTSTDLPAPDNPTDTQVEEINPDIVCAEKIEELKELAASKDKNKSVLIEVDDDKTKRTQVHRAIADSFPGILDSSTISKDDKKFVEVKISANKENGLRKWPKHRGNYCRFVLYKENKDTMDAVGLIARQLGLKGGMFQYAGTKDKRAKTSQEVTVYRVQAEKLQHNNKRLRNIVTGNYCYVKEPLKLGNLQGNKFTIILRSVTGSSQQIHEAMKSLAEKGFINYYGMQRFGTSTVPTHSIGRALLSSDWKKAVELILKPRPRDTDEIDIARKLWWKTRNSKETLDKMPKYQFIERSVLQGLVDYGENNFLGALNKVARNTRLMYVHSYQSYIWNKVVSERISKYGIQPVIGDLAVSGEINQQECEVEENSCVSMTKVKPVVLTEDNIESYSIYDVVLPLPGYDVNYPKNMAELYKTSMLNDGLDYMSMRHKNKDYSLSGAYRHMLVRPKGVDWSTYKYNDVALPLALSDWDKMNGESKPESIQDGKYVALKIELTLPTSCYATMAIREVLKMDTSSAHQSTLNVT